MKKVFVSGRFELIHPGHIRLLEYAKSLGDYLIVGLLKSRPGIVNDYGFSHEDKVVNLSSLLMIDEVISLDSVNSDVLFQIRPQVIVKGREFEGQRNIEEDYISKTGGDLIFDSGDPFDHRFVFDCLPGGSAKLVNNFFYRYQIQLDQLSSLVTSFSDLKVVVIGDLIVDEYVQCEALGMSREDASIVMREIDSSSCIGGAGIIAAHCSALGATVKFASVIGNDESGHYALQQLEEWNIDCSAVLIDKSRVTTRKTRYKIDGKTMARLTKLKETEISIEAAETLLKFVNSVANEADLILISDFNYGVMTPHICDALSELSSSRSGTIFVADCQSSSQTGDLTKYKNMELVTPTEREARLAVRNSSAGFPTLFSALHSNANSKYILLTLGKEGALIYDSTRESIDQFPSLNVNPVDVSGAGDSMMCVGGMCLAAGGNIWEATVLASIAAAVQLKTEGNKPLVTEDLRLMMQAL